jgi:hypothetical protein
MVSGVGWSLEQAGSWSHRTGERCHTWAGSPRISTLILEKQLLRTRQRLPMPTLEDENERCIGRQPLVEDLEHVIIEREDDEEVLRVVPPDLHTVGRHFETRRQPTFDRSNGDRRPHTVDRHDQREVQGVLFSHNLFGVIQETKLDERPLLRHTKRKGRWHR